MKIIFMGTPAFAVPSLDILLRNGCTISAVVTAPDRPRGRGQRVAATPVKEFAAAQALPLLQPENLKDNAFRSAIENLHPDLIVVVAFRILPASIFTIPTCGSFNLHASLLPKYRGAAPINWAIINGEKETGVTTFFLQERVDTGNIILQASTPIGGEMTAGDLHDVLARLGADLVLRTVQRIGQGDVKTLRQDSSAATPAPKIFPGDCRIAWGRSAREIHNFIRGLSPTPAAWTRHDERLIKIFRSVLAVDGPAGLGPGSIGTIGDRLFVGTKDRPVELLEVQQEGKKRMSAAEFVRGYRVLSPDTFN